MALDSISPALTNPVLNVPRTNQVAATAASAAASALDARQQGVVDRVALQTALSSTVVPTSKTAPDPTLAQALDRNGNGVVTTEELTAQTQTLADRLFGNLRQTADSGPVTVDRVRKAPLTEADPSATETAQPQAQSAGSDGNAVQLGNPGRVMALMNLMDLVSAYGPTGQPNTPTLPSGKTVDVSV